MLLVGLRLQRIHPFLTRVRGLDPAKMRALVPITRMKIDTAPGWGDEQNVRAVVADDRPPVRGLIPNGLACSQPREAVGLEADGGEPSLANAWDHRDLARLKEWTE